MSPRDWRPITWLFVVFNIAMAIWFVTTVGGSEPVPVDECGAAAGDRSVCELEQNARSVSVPGGGENLGIWLGGSILLAVLWWATNQDIPHRPVWKVVKTVIGVALGGIMLVAGFMSLGDEARRSQARSALALFAEHLSDYTRDDTRSAGTSPYIHGRVIPVLVPTLTGIEGASINERLYLRLAGDLRAASPDEVATVVWTECGWSDSLYMGDFGSVTTYHQCECKVRLVDLSTDPPTAVRASRRFDMGDPPETLSADASRYSDCPWRDIASYLKELPRS
jgi:hypothetical protein